MFPQILNRVCAESKLQLLRESWVVGQETGGAGQTSQKERKIFTKRPQEDQC